jgi:hypothetical protein
VFNRDLVCCYLRKEAAGSPWCPPDVLCCLLESFSRKSPLPPLTQDEARGEYLQANRVVQATVWFNQQLPRPGLLNGTALQEIAEKAAQQLVRDTRGAFYLPLAASKASLIVFSRGRVLPLNPEEVATRIVEEFVKKLDAYPSYHALSEDRLGAVLYEFGQKIVRSLLRKEKRWRHPSLPTDVGEADWATVDPWEPVRKQQSREEDLRVIRQNCDDVDWTIVQMLLVGNSPGVIAEHLGLTRDAIYQRIFRLKGRLRDGE